MKHERSEIAFLLGLLLILSTVIGVLHTQPTAVKDHISQSQVMTFIAPYVITEAVEKIVETLKMAEYDNVRSVLITLIDTQRLSPQDLLEILFGMALSYKDNPQQQKKMLNLIDEKPILKKGGPLLYRAARSSYSDIIPDLLVWLQEGSTQHPDLKNEIMDSFKHGIHAHDLKSLEIMERKGIAIDSPLATQLAWFLVNEKKGDADSARFLFKFKPDLNYARDGYTLLMHAAAAGNRPLVEALVTFGASRGLDINTMVKPEIGTALQLVLDEEYKAEKKKDKQAVRLFVGIEEFLRDHGAREYTGDQESSGQKP